MAVPKRSAPELKALLERTIGQAPHDIERADTWLFVYGSMLENPPFEATERQVAVMKAFRRSFCLSDPMLRGTEAQPGLTLGLALGGECIGLAWRLSHHHARRAIEAFWTAEMELPLYNAAWHPIEVKDHDEVAALVLLADPLGPLFEPGLSQNQVAERISRCRGSKGSNADYLFEAAGGLKRAGVADPDLEALVVAVKAAASGQRRDEDR